MSRWLPRDEHGSATVLVVPLIGVLAVATLLAAFLAGGLAAKRRAQSAADLAALAGAGAAQAGRDACAEARLIAERNRAATTSCSQDGADVLVEVRLPAGDLFGYRLSVVGRARAGPSS